MIEPGENRMAGAGTERGWRALYRREGDRAWFDGDELRDGLRPGVRWEPRNGRFEFKQPDGTLVAWAPNPTGGARWCLAVARAPKLGPVVEEEPPKGPPGNRPLVNPDGSLAVPWGEMTTEERRLAVRTGIVVLKQREPRPLSESTIMQQARARARAEAAMRLDKDPATAAWAEANHLEFESVEAVSARRDYAEWYERRFRRSLPARYYGGDDGFDRMFR